MKSVQTHNAPEAVGPYSQAIIEKNIVYCSGQIGLDPKTGELVPGIEKQTKQILSNLHAVLIAANSEVNKVIKTTIYLTNIADFVTVNKIYASFFNNHKPARVTICVAALPKGALIEIDAIASI